MHGGYHSSVSHRLMISPEYYYLKDLELLFMCQLEEKSPHVFYDIILKLAAKERKLMIGVAAETESTNLYEDPTPRENIHFRRN